MVSPCWGEWLRWSWRWGGNVAHPPGLTLHPELHRGLLLFPDAAARQTTEPCTHRQGTNLSLQERTAFLHLIHIKGSMTHKYGPERVSQLSNALLKEKGKQHELRINMLPMRNEFQLRSSAQLKVRWELTFWQKLEIWQQLQHFCSRGSEGSSKV